MSRKIQTLVVVDASVARAAGETIHPTSKSCRDFMIEFRNTKNKIVMSNKIFEEWKKHQSRFALQWRANLIASKRWIKVDDVEIEAIRECLELKAPSQKAKNEILKDLHLVEAAIQTDKLIVSCDNKMRVLLSKLTNDSKELNDIVWVNPVNDNENAVEWVKQGCANEAERQLVNFSSSQVASS